MSFIFIKFSSIYFQPGIQIFLIRYPWGYAYFTPNRFQIGVPNFTNLIPDRRRYFDLNIALKFHVFGHTISQKLCLKVPVSGFFLSRYPYSIRDLILNKRTSKDARLTPR